VATALFAGACLLAIGLWHGPAQVPAPETLVVAMSVEGADGQVFGSPVVLAPQGRRLRLDLVCEDDPRRERMSLVLDPVRGDDGSLRYSYSLSVPGRFSGEKGTVDLSPGQEKRIAVRPGDPRRGVTLALFAAPVRDRRVEPYLRHRRARLAKVSS